MNTIATVVCKRSIFLPKFKDDRENGIKHTETFDLSRFRFIDQRTELLPGVVLFPSIKIEDKEDTHFERFFVQQDDGNKIPDTFEDELAVALPCELLLGGFHIHNAEEQKYHVISDYLQRYMPRQIGVCHCTGVDKYAFFCKDFGDRIFYNHTGRVI